MFLNKKVMGIGKVPSKHEPKDDCRTEQSNPSSIKGASEAYSENLLSVTGKVGIL